MTIATCGCCKTDRWLASGEGGGGAWRGSGAEAGRGVGRGGGGGLGGGVVQVIFIQPVIMGFIVLYFSVSSLCSFLLPFLSYTLRLVLGIPCISVRFA